MLSKVTQCAGLISSHVLRFAVPFEPHMFHGFYKEDSGTQTCFSGTKSQYSCAVLVRPPLQKVLGSSWENLGICTMFKQNCTLTWKFPDLRYMVQLVYKKYTSPESLKEQFLADITECQSNKCFSHLCVYMCYSRNAVHNTMSIIQSTMDLRLPK